VFKHLSEENIQKFLDKDITDSERINYKNHLNECSECRKRFEDYKYLYNQLAKDFSSGMSSSFEEKVLSKIQAVNNKQVNKGTREILFSFIGILIGLAITLFYTGTSFVSSFYEEIKFSLYENLSKFFENISLTQLFDRFNLLIMAGFILVIFAAIDNYLLKRQLRI
jgi:uncharacterized protein YacL